MKRLLLIALGAICLAAAPISAPVAAQAQGADTSPLQFQVLRTSDASLNVNVSLIMGERDAVLVDAPFTLADAHRVVAMVLDSGKKLTHVFVTHDHPDHFFAMEVIKDAFPGAAIVAHPQVTADIWRSLPFKVRRWSPMLGYNGPRHPSAPLALEGDAIMLEGHRLEVIGPMAGDHHNATALWVPDIEALFPGDLVFNQMHLWLGEHDAGDVAAWSQSLDRLAQLGPRTVVAGHSAPGLDHSVAGLEFSRAYLAAWPRLVMQAQDSAQLTALVQGEFPQAIDALDNFILGNSVKVAMGEEPKWQE